MSWLFASGGQSIRASASASVLPMNIQDWFPLGWTGLISLLFKGLSSIFSSITVWKHCSTFFMVYLSDPYMTTGKTIALTIQTFVGKVMSLLFNMLSTLVVAFLSRSKRVLFCFLPPTREQASFNFMAAVTVHSDFGAHENKVCHCFYFFPTYLPWSDGTGCHDLTFWTVAHQTPLSMGFSRQEYWSRLPCPPPGDLPDPGIKPASLCLLHCQADSLPLVPPGKPLPCGSAILISVSLLILHLLLGIIL